MGYISDRARELRRNATPEEARMWYYLRDYRSKGYAFRRQYPVGQHYVGNTSYYYVADFCCLKARLIIEIDGPIHTDLKEHDELRQRIIESRNFTVIRFTNDEVNNQIIQVFQKIETYLPNFNQE